MNKKYLKLVLGLIGLAFFFIYYSNNYCNHLNCLESDFLNRFEQREIFSNSTNNFRALYNYKNFILRLEITRNIDFVKADKIINETLANVQAFYQESTAPYPGEISNQVSCDKVKIPILHEQNTDSDFISYFFSWLNNRFAYSCNQTEDFYNSVTLFIYCENQKKFYKLEVISSVKMIKFDDKFVKENLNFIKCK